MNASLALQRRLWAALHDIAGIAGVFDGPAPDAPPPYLVIGPDLVGDWGTKTEAGHEHRVAVTAWLAGPGAAAAKALLGEVETRVLALGGAAGGIRIVSARLARALVLPEAAGWTQGIAEFRIRTTAA